MKTWKLVSGILSIVLSLIVGLQSCAATIADALAEEGSSGFYGTLVFGLMMALGIVSIVTRKKKSVAVLVLGVLGFLFGFAGAGAGSFADLAIWGMWCGVCAILAIIALATGKKKPVESEGSV